MEHSKPVVDAPNFSFLLKATMHALLRSNSYSLQKLYRSQCALNENILQWVLYNGFERDERTIFEGHSKYWLWML